MRSPTTDALRLKMAGLVCSALGLVGTGTLGEVLGGGEWLADAAPRTLAWFAAGWLVAAHLLAAGLILLLAGLQNVPLLTSGRALGGAVRKLAGSTLLILCFAYVAIADIPAYKGIIETWWIELPSLFAFVVCARAGVLLVRSGWKYDALSAEQLLAIDPRPPIVYLRSFEIDDRILIATAGFWGKAMSWLVYTTAVSPEQELAMVLDRVGPVIAIGKPGEPVPELGAARLYVGDADWKAKVEEMLDRSRLVIIRAGTTPNLWWEIEQTMARVPHRQILFVNLGAAADIEAFDRRFEERFGRPRMGDNAVEPPLWLRLASPGRAVSGKIIYFDVSLQPREEPIRLTFTLTGLTVGMMRPYRDTIQSAMRRVFASLDLPWLVRRSQAAAVLLAFVGGAFGLHHFYLGDRARGLKQLKFFWTFVPMFLGWVASVKLARLDSRQFREKYSD